MKAGEVLAEKYRLEKRLGLGGMGEVWSVSHAGTGREFAVKLMHAHSATSASARQRFTREARVSAKINHPCVIDVFDVGETDDGCLYLVMELLDGVTLSEAFHGAPALSIRDFLSIMLDVVSVLEAAHAVGVVHRDIKSSNIFLHRDRASGLFSPKVLDFGISKLSGNADANNTKTGAVLGSPRYMSPEQTRSAANVDHRADLWALGVVLFEGLTGTWPHEGDSFSSLVVSICTIPPASIDLIAPSLPESVRSIVRECLRPAEARLVSAEALANRIEAILQDPSLAQITLPRPQHPPSDGARAMPAGLVIRPPARVMGASLAHARGTGERRPSYDSFGNLTPVSGPYPVALSISDTGQYPQVYPVPRATPLPASPPGPAAGARAVAAQAPYPMAPPPRPYPMAPPAPPPSYPVAHAMTSSGSYPVANPMTPSGSYPVANPMTPSGSYPVANPMTPSGMAPGGNPQHFPGAARPDGVFRPTAKTLTFPAVGAAPSRASPAPPAPFGVAMPRSPQGGLDPLVGTASAMSVEALGRGSVSGSSPPLAPTLMQPSEPPPAQAAARSRGKRRALAALALLALAGIGITAVFLFSSGKTSPASGGPAGDLDLRAPTAPSASAQVGGGSPPSAPTLRLTASASAAPTAPSAAPSGSSSAAPSARPSGSKALPKVGKSAAKLE